MGNRKPKVAKPVEPVPAPDVPPEEVDDSPLRSDTERRFYDSLKQRIRVPRLVRRRDAAEFIQSLFCSGD